MTKITLDMGTVANVLPFALVFAPDGRVEHVGPTLAKIAPRAMGRPMAQTLRFTHPRIGATPETVLARVGRRLRLEIDGGQGVGPTAMRCLSVPLADGWGLLNLSFSGDPTQAMRRHQLTAQDFSQVDPTVDLMFLVEAHRIVLSQFERLGERLKEALVAAEEEAITDTLTGLRNRRALDFHLGRLVRRRVPRFGLMHLDLDRFKEVNDTLGHGAGDLVLKAVARILSEHVRSGDLVARVGGDEFLLVFDECGDIERLKQIAARIIERLEQPIAWEGKPCRISGSVGITMSEFYDHPNLEKMIADADDALYLSKRAGRGRCTVALPNRTLAGAP
ncbi:putative diguanylate cyclase YegE [Jannaschia seosinensis]|uniref:Putative diguanylate cyclase YegE n=1 Tax=Jannaschia seosinensis TaxID=313367 RepID=A0A0M7B592_9RHOB|nr:GGDEF domain-containing protein [Jannaschia seosinensis]CUH21318.1 putative diguanylate cyclase YegE [Jannaschia seosinensis]